MKIFGGICGLALAALSVPACGQKVDPVMVSGSIEQFFIDAGFGPAHKTTDRFTRFNLEASSGKWELKGSHWYSPYYVWYELDETTLSYTDADFRARIGRFLLPVGQTNWDDQWYSGFVIFPLIESKPYANGRQLLMRTSIGADLEKSIGDHTLRVSLTNSDREVDKILARQWDRASVRWSWSKDGIILGLSAFGDIESGGGEEKMLIADARWTIPQWTVRGEILKYETDSAKVDGYFVDVLHRPKGWSDVTLVGRFERRATKGQFDTDMQAWTVGAKVRLPMEALLFVNYKGGPDMNRVFLGGGWELGLMKTFKF